MRETEARAICTSCPVRRAVPRWAREQREYGFWGGESEEDRAAAGFRVDMPVGRVARYPKGDGNARRAPHPARRLKHSERSPRTPGVPQDAP